MPDWVHGIPPRSNRHPDLDATHRFYTEAMGFELVKVEAAPTPEPGWARHLFYDTGNGEMLAVWDLHDPTLDGYRTEISTGLGLPRGRTTSRSIHPTSTT